ncbi:MAG: hypothetical protein WBW84_19415 [Acidobacteriaceae bacterium]
MPNGDLFFKVAPWIERARRKNRRFTSYQFHFRCGETPVEGEFRGYIPRDLIAILDLYLRRYRKYLIRGKDPGTLLLNVRGGSMTASEFIKLVRNLTSHLGRRVTPTAVRRIFAYAWLRDNPGKYEELARILWIDIDTAKRRYGRGIYSTGTTWKHQQKSSPGVHLGNVRVFLVSPGGRRPRFGVDQSPSPHLKSGPDRLFGTCWSGPDFDQSDRIWLLFG